MRCPTLSELPPPPPDKTGWPWTEERPQLPDLMPDGSAWPCISIVTPSYNQGQFIEETIRSVLLQSYPNLEYIVIDGGSTDNSVEIIKKYQEHLAFWSSEPDRGQTDAINNGYQHCTGDIFVWLNSDDLYYNPLVLKTVADLFLKGYDYISGECFYIDENGNQRLERVTDSEVLRNQLKLDGKSIPTTFNKLLRYWSGNNNFMQPATFVSKELTDLCFPLDPELYYAMDYQLFIRVLKRNPKAIWIREKLVRFRWHSTSKTMGDIAAESELYKVSLAESRALSTWWEHALFKRQASDFEDLLCLIHGQTFPQLWQVLIHLVYRPTSIASILFWKVFFKAAIGVESYSLLRKLAGK
ncbi:glycosyltransferase family 2 protein [Chamaesiphon sp. VAR_48_metabat_135_sub]|uniref:glycosyltransferase family 2 protein n=1 Tax=Chamaesiphon sp. VAR_48_metabat_135_sub TaxID=2964699 RepID=UPI00286AFB5E|nr:glycosyltransferase family 2 protein [Chamaesiphon sp. VAR_48_metabat_135_sub]